MFVYEATRYRDWYCKLVARLIAKMIQPSCINPYIHHKVFYLECCNKEDDNTYSNASKSKCANGDTSEGEL